MATYCEKCGRGHEDLEKHLITYHSMDNQTIANYIANYIAYLEGRIETLERAQKSEVDSY
ncbi:MAG: hypothetical protein WCF23_03685 [Candidatus Nitrosopolaris sp.]